jgi:hypothetical protein
MVTFPVEADTLTVPAPATDVTPAFVRVVVPPRDTDPPPDKPVPAVTVTELLVSWLLAMPPNVPPRVTVPIVVIGPPVRVIPFTLPAVLT